MAEKARETAHLAREKGAAVAQTAGDMADAAVDKARELIAQEGILPPRISPSWRCKVVNKLNLLKDVMPAAIQVQIDKLNALIGCGDVVQRAKSSVLGKLVTPIP